MTLMKKLSVLFVTAVLSPALSAQMYDFENAKFYETESEMFEAYKQYQASKLSEKESYPLMLSICSYASAETDVVCEKEAQKGNAAAEFGFAQNLFLKDDHSAMTYYEKSAAQGFPHALNKLSSIYELGDLGQKADSAKAAAFKQKAYDAGFPKY